MKIGNYRLICGIFTTFYVRHNIVVSVGDVAVKSLFFSIVGKRRQFAFYTKKHSYLLLTIEQMFCIMIFVILSLYAGKARKQNIGVNILSGLFVRQRGGRLT